ncbi:MAG: outer rane lipoprotein carrier protein LolA [Bacteroidetes bacterium]|nr:outer rane lipoprotein carrier protein LolA [Bacteroidota bacterium]
MIKKIILLSIALISFLACFSQEQGYKKLSDKEKDTYIKKLSSEVKSLQCNFKQEKKSSLLSGVNVSKGVMYFETPNLLRWEYTQPTSYMFIVNKEKIQVKNSQGEFSNSNKMFQEISKIIIGIISGKELQNNKNFNSDFYTNDKDLLLVKMTPINRRLKSMFKTVTIIVDDKTLLANIIEMNETNGDITTITFSNKKKNIQIPKQTFSLK